MKPSKNIQEDLKKNRPSMLPPIINTVFAGIFLIGVILLKIFTDALSLGIFVGLVVVIVFFPITSWYNSYISKKQKTKMLKNYERETELILEFTKERKNYFAVNEGEKVKITYKYVDTVDVFSYSYNSEKSSLGFLDSTKTFISIGIGFTGLEVDPSTNEVTNIKGLLPRSIWLKKNLKVPTGNKGKLFVNATGVELRNKTYILTLQQADTYYDSKKGYICIGETKTYSYDDVVEFADGALMVLRDEKIVSLWIKVGPSLSLVY